MQKTPALLLAFLLLAANLAAELAHHHFWPPEKNANGQIETAAPKITSGPQRCCACLFAHEHHSILSNISFSVILPLSFTITLFTLHHFSQFNKTSRRNRAPPLAEWMIV